MTWYPVTKLADLLPERPVAALVDGAQVVVVRLLDDRVFVVGQLDPFSGANVISRGIVGSVLRDGEEIPTIHSPMYKQAFDLRTGLSLGEARAALGSWDVQVREGIVVVGPQVVAATPPMSGLLEAS